ncbi:hypothetical protein RHSIM_Rhsim07G0164300 [Rhododendron simsii]|uniref:Uncharacterized protein n=1 Tax=Rhododendron simsii TaxID=118357 RepID=A0A834GPJ5_RHOSS|nr:hypothetical protein RHSIM_Rhsim07G0164300 [Rhododendron simsii]
MKMETHPIIEVINQRDLQFFSDPIKGYKSKLVLSVYENMDVDESQKKIESYLGKKTVLTEEEIHNALTDKPLKDDLFIHCKLFEKYRVIKKVVHYNLFPHGSEKQPRKEDGEVIFVFGSSEEVVDCALFIWREIVRFNQWSGPSKPNIPFPAMVFAICEDQEAITLERLFLGTPGPIMGGSLDKSKSLS